MWSASIVPRPRYLGRRASVTGGDGSTGAGEPFGLGAPPVQGATAVRKA